MSYKVTVSVTDTATGRTLSRSLTTGPEMVEDAGAWVRTMDVLRVKMSEQLHTEYEGSERQVLDMLHP